jgi:Flp pilus assembly protein TadD
MAHIMAHPSNFAPFNVIKIATLAATLMLGACSQSSDLLSDAAKPLASADSSAKGTNTQTELQKATEYWGNEYQKKPADLQTALNYSRNLKALGEKQKAFSILQQASVLHGSNAELASEYGRMALDFDQINVASRLLEIADSPTNPDWKVISARGTVLAKQGLYKDAIPFYERALALAPNQTSILNNLALANAMSGDAQKAEDILRQVADKDAGAPKVKQNLALVLGLQGKYDEAKSVGGSTLTADAAAENSDYVRKMVRLTPQAAPAGSTGAATSGFATKVLPASGNASAALRPAMNDQGSTAAWQTDVASAPENAPVFKGSAR